MLKEISLLQKAVLVFFGLCLAIIVLETGLRIGGFAILSLQEYKNLQSIKQKGSFRIMCLGESTTQNQYPTYLEEILNQNNINIKFSVIDKGIAGIRTSSILSQLEANLDKYQPNIVITMIGINDGGNHIPYEIACSSKPIIALRSFRAYKLTRLLWLRMATKLKEIGFYTQDINKQKDSPNEIYEELQQEQAPKALDTNPNNDSVCIELGQFYQDQGKLAEAEQAFNKALELNPRNDSACVELGGLYQYQGKCQHKFGGPEEAFKKAIELNPDNESARAALGQFYMDSERLVESEQTLKEAVEFNPKHCSAYVGLGRLYLSQGRLAESEQILKKAVEFNPDNKLVFEGLAAVYSEMGNDKLFDIYVEKANNLRGEYYNPATVNNYRTLKQILDKRKIKLVCAEYPMRNIALLKKIFKEDTEGSVVFVDNEKVFKDAIRKEGYKEYFIDMFGGNFGHCTSKGNELLARNIANMILKEVFDKK